MRDKSKRLRGSGTHGRGYNKHKSGARGGTGRAGLWDHKKISQILELKKKKKVTCVRDIESKLDRYLKKKYMTQRIVKTDRGEERVFSFTRKFSEKYCKILSQGQASGKYLPTRGVKFSKNTSAKML